MKFNVIVMHFDQPLAPTQEDILISEFQCFQQGVVKGCDTALEALGKVKGKYDQATTAATRFVPLIGSMTGMNDTVSGLFVTKLMLIKTKVEKFYILEKTEDPKIYKFYMPSTDTDIANFKAVGKQFRLQIYTPIKLMKEIREKVFPRMGISHFNMTCEETDFDPEKEG